jgi:spore maturation protein CgeB
MILHAAGRTAKVIAISPKQLSILYIGAGSGTCRQRFHALQRLGHEVTQIDLRESLPNSRLLTYWIHHTGGLAVSSVAKQALLSRIRNSRYDLAWIDGGQLVCPSLVDELRKHCDKVLCYNIDDPFGMRDGPRFCQYRRSARHYDLLVVVRECNVVEAKRVGARDVLHVFRAADEVAHAPRILSDEDVRKWGADVAFIGTWMPERGPFLARLVQLGVPLTIRGNNWRRAREWPVLQRHWGGHDLKNETEYAKAIQCAKVCLGLVSKGNRDASTSRSFEIPFLGGVFCAERTPEHSFLYKENQEAVFWSSPEECAQQCKRLLADESLRGRLREKGRARCLRNRTTNEPILKEILQRALTA